MANLKDLKLRIRSVKSTQKITKAMKMVSASKLRRAKEAIETNRPYTEKMNEITKVVASHIENAHSISLFYGKKDIKDIVFIVITSDRGLCGALNSSVVRLIKRKLAESKSQGHIVKVLCIGKKGFEQLAILKDTEIQLVDDFIYGKKIRVEPIRKLAKVLVSDYGNSMFDICYVFFNEFISSVCYNTTFKQIIPVFTKQETLTENLDNQFIFEPEAEKMVDDLIERNLTVNLFSVILENIASEHGARMTAMENASSNAGEMIKDLNILYNRKRQSAITTELIEIIAGAEAL